MNRRGINRHQCVPTSMAQRIFNNTGRWPMFYATNSARMSLIDLDAPYVVKCPVCIKYVNMDYITYKQRKISNLSSSVDIGPNNIKLTLGKQLLFQLYNNP